MKFVCVSDTHLRHPDLSKYPGEVIIHAGDCTMGGKLKEVLLFLEWFSSLPYIFKIMIPGNHDFFFEENFSLAKSFCDEKKIICLNDSKVWIPRKIENFDNVVFDENTPLSGTRPFLIWGSPITPYFYGWAFNRQRGPEIQRHWSMIPSSVDILITHGPPANVGNLSKVLGGEDVGCAHLKLKVEEIKPKYHIFGHIHEGYGVVETPDTIYVNCSSLNRNYNLVNEPICFELE